MTYKKPREISKIENKKKQQVKLTRDILLANKASSKKSATFWSIVLIQDVSENPPTLPEKQFREKMATFLENSLIRVAISLWPNKIGKDKQAAP